MSADIASVSYVLSSVASVGKILESVQNLLRHGAPLTSEKFEEVEAQAEAAADRRIANGSFDNAYIASKMTAEIIETIKTEMNRILERIKQVYRDRTLRIEEKSRMIADMQKEYCWHLREIKRRVGDVLPPDLEEEWASNKCDDFLLP